MHKSDYLMIGIVLVSSLALAVIFTACKSDPAVTPDNAEGATLQFESFDGGGPDYSVTVDDPSVVSYTSERKYHKDNHEELDGAAYSMIYTFRGLKPGETTVTISARSPIADNFDTVYKAVVDANLHVTLTQTQTNDWDDVVIEPSPTQDTN